MSGQASKRSWISFLACACVLLFGGTATISQTTYLQHTTTNWPGAEGEVKKFQYPWFGNFWMFLGMGLVGFWWLFEELRDRKHERAARAAAYSQGQYPGGPAAPGSAPGMGPGMAAGAPAVAVAPAARPTCWNRFLSNPWGVLIFSSVFDLLGSGLNSVGISPNFGVPGSIYQMLHGVIILFTVMLSYFVLKHKPTVQQYISLAIIVVGIVLVATSSLLVEKYFNTGGEEAQASADAHVLEAVRFVRSLRGVGAAGRATGGDASVVDVTPLSSSAGSLVAGLFLILLGNFVYACQFTLEEFTMRRVTKCRPSQVVAIEGIYGFVITIAILYPLLIGLGVENDFEAFTFMSVEPAVITPVMIFFVSIPFLNIAGQTVTKRISASHRTIIEAMRGLVVWVFALIQRAIFGAPWGEGFYSWASAIEIVGFVILTVGSLSYYGIINFPCLPENKRKVKAVRGGDYGVVTYDSSLASADSVSLIGASN